MPNLIPHQSAVYHATAELTPQSRAFVALLQQHDGDPRLEGAGLATRSLAGPQPQVEIRGVYRVRPNQQCSNPDVALVADMQGGAVLSLSQPVATKSLI